MQSKFCTEGIVFKLQIDEDYTNIKIKIDT